MGCGSSKETAPPNQPNRLAKPPNVGQVPRQQQQQQHQPLPGGLPGGQQPQHQASQPLGSQIQAASGVWPKVLRLGATSVTVSVHAHVLSSGQGQRPCWTFISRGLSEVSQPEVVFTIARRPNENPESFPESPVEWIKTVHGLAKNGLHLETGQLVELVFDKGLAFLKINQAMIVQNPNQWESMRRFGSLCHGISLSNSIFEFPPGTLPRYAHHLIALTHEETVVAKQFGVTRVVGHLGLSVRWFPYPPWVDRDRGDVTNMADQAGSVRIGVPIARMYGFSATLANDDIIFSIPPGEEKRKAFKDLILNSPLSAVAGFDSFMVAEADSGLLWKKGQTGPLGYASDNQSMNRLNLGFIMFVPQQETDTSIMCEDGYGILIRDSTWQAIRDAIQNTQDITIPLTDSKRFILQWKRSVYHNPIDGFEYTSSWKTYHSSEPPKPSSSHVKMTEIVFLTEPPGGAIDVQELAAYIEGIFKIIEQQTPVNPLPAPPGVHPGRQAVVELQLPKCEGWLKMTAYPSLEGIEVQTILGRIAALVAPEARDVAKLQLYIDLWGYQGPARFS